MKDEAVVATEATEATEAVAVKKENGSKIKCTKCGGVFGMSAGRKARLIERLGDNYREVYVCRGCRKELGIDRGGNEKQTVVQGLHCSKCGQFKGATSDRIAKLISIHGSEEAMKANYLCRACRPHKVKETKETKNGTKKDKKAKAKVTEANEGNE